MSTIERKLPPGPFLALARQLAGIGPTADAWICWETVDKGELLDVAIVYERQAKDDPAKAPTTQRSMPLPPHEAIDACSHPGAHGPCIPRSGDGRCIWCERPMRKESVR